MSSRVTFTQINSLVQSNISRNYAKLSRLQEQLSTGQKIQRPSDAPVDLTNDLQLRSDLKQLEQFKRNIEDGMSYMAIVESSVGGMNDVFQRMRELALQGANDTNTGDERRYIMSEIRVLTDSMVAISNRSYKGGFVFSGTETRTAPFEIREGREVIDSVDLSATDSTDTSLSSGPLPVTIKLYDRNVTDSVAVPFNPRGSAPVSHVFPDTVNIGGLTEGTDYTVNYVEGTVTFLPAGTVTIPGVGDLTPAQIAAADPASYPAWPPAGDPAWAGASTQPQPGGGLNVSFEWVRRSEKDLEGKIYRETEVGLMDQINLTASEVFGEPDEVSVWDAAISLMEGLYNNEGTGIRASISQINETFDRTLAAQASLGSRLNRIEMTQTRNEESYIETTRLNSILEDVDFAEVISEFLLQESVYSASLQSGSRIIQPTLANFL